MGGWGAITFILHLIILALNVIMGNVFHLKVIWNFIVNIKQVFKTLPMAVKGSLLTNFMEKIMVKNF